MESAQQMHDAVMAAAPAQDVIIKAAAVADYRPAHTAGEKIKKSGADLTLELTRTPDILAELGAARRPGQFLCGFAMETRDLLDNARAKLEKKGADMIVANSLREAGAGFGGATNHVTLVEPTGCTELPLAGKDEVAHRILDRILARRAGA